MAWEILKTHNLRKCPPREFDKLNVDFYCLVKLWAVITLDVQTFDLASISWIINRLWAHQVDMLKAESSMALTATVTDGIMEWQSFTVLSNALQCHAFLHAVFILARKPMRPCPMQNCPLNWICIQWSRLSSLFSSFIQSFLYISKHKICMKKKLCVCGREPVFFSSRLRIFSSSCAVGFGGLLPYFACTFLFLSRKQDFLYMQCIQLVYQAT